MCYQHSKLYGFSRHSGLKCQKFIPCDLTIYSKDRIVQVHTHMLHTVSSIITNCDFFFFFTKGLGKSVPIEHYRGVRNYGFDLPVLLWKVGEDPT